MTKAGSSESLARLCARACRSVKAKVIERVQKLAEAEFER
jgi:hypothetical protein